MVEILKSRYAAINAQRLLEEAMFGRNAKRQLRAFHETLPEKIRPPPAPQYDGLRYWLQRHREEGNTR